MWVLKSWRQYDKVRVGVSSTVDRSETTKRDVYMSVRESAPDSLPEGYAYVPEDPETETCLRSIKSTESKTRDGEVGSFSGHETSLSSEVRLST